jgi:tetratricopeptide (TPR) repeat protein
MEALMKRSVLISSGTLAFAFIAGGALAQMGTANGKVVDGDGQPVPKARVRFEVGGNFTLALEGKTDKNGKFIIITSQTDGPWAITVSKEGYMDYYSKDFILVPLRQITEIPTITLWKEGDERAPIRATEDEAAKLEAARKAFEALKIQVEQAVSLVDAGQAAQRSGDDVLARQKYDEAIAAYNALIETHPDIPELHFNLGIVYKYKQEWNLAAASFLKAAELKPQMIEAYSAASGAYMNIGQADKALEILTKGTEAHPDNPKLLFLLAVVSYNAAEYDKAGPLFAKVKETDPSNPEPHYYLGMIAVTQNKTAECVSHLEKYISMNPSNAQNLQAAKDVLGALKPKK